MRLKHKREWHVHPDGSKMLVVSVVNAATGESIEGVRRVGKITPLDGGVEVLRIETSMFDEPPEETIRIVQVQAPPTPEPELPDKPHADELEGHMGGTR
jgi:hypothetical protein